MTLDPTVRAGMVLIGACWVVLLGVFFVLTYVLYERSPTLHSIGDFFIKFSFLKRTKSILLGYGFLAITIGLLGLMMIIVSR